MSQLKYFKILGAASSILIGIIFIYSAYTKLFPIEFFELTFVDMGIANWNTAPIIARLFIGTEFFLGCLMLFNLNPSRRTYKFVILFLIALTLYLFVQILLYGNKGNCGCFGYAIVMTPLEGIIKNILLIAVLFLLYSFYHGIKLKAQKYIIPFLGVLALTLPFILNPVLLNVSSQFDKSITGYKLNLDLLYNNPGNPTPDKDLRKGKWVVAYFSLTCSHCKTAAYKLQIIQKNNPGIPIYFILNGEEKNIKTFFDEKKLNNVPYILFKGIDFFKMSGPDLPAIFLLENGIVKAKLNYFTLNQSEIENWLLNNSDLP